MSWKKADSKDRHTVYGYTRQNQHYDIPHGVTCTVLAYYHSPIDYFESSSNPNVTFSKDCQCVDVTSDPELEEVICGTKSIDMMNINNQEKEWKWRIKLEGKLGIRIGIQSTDKQCEYCDGFCWCYGDSCLLTSYGAVVKSGMSNAISEWIKNFGKKETIVDINIKKCEFGNSGYYYVQFNIIYKDNEVSHSSMDSQLSSIKVHNIPRDYYQLVIVFTKKGQKAQILQGPSIRK